MQMRVSLPQVQILPQRADWLMPVTRLIFFFFTLILIKPTAWPASTETRDGGGGAGGF